MIIINVFKKKAKKGLVWFYGISTNMGYLMTNPVYSPPPHKHPTHNPIRIYM